MTKIFKLKDLNFFMSGFVDLSDVDILLVLETSTSPRQNQYSTRFENTTTRLGTGHLNINTEFSKLSLKLETRRGQISSGDSGVQNPI